MTLLALRYLLVALLWGVVLYLPWRFRRHPGAVVLAAVGIAVALYGTPQLLTRPVGYVGEMLVWIAAGAGLSLLNVLRSRGRRPSAEGTPE